MIGGQRLEIGAVVGTLDTDFPADQVLGSLRVNQLTHVPLEADPPAPKPTPKAAPKPEVKPATNDAGTPLDRSVLNDKVVKVLESAGITTVELLRAEIARGTDLTYLRGIGPKAAEELAAYAAE